MTNFVLIHGSWGGGWQWNAISRYLSEFGHAVAAPTLRGMASSDLEASAETGLLDHITDITEIIVQSGNHDAVLVGHSYAGMIIAGVQARIPHLVRSLVYIDAFFPREGESAWDIFPWQREMFDNNRNLEEPWMIDPPKEVFAMAVNIDGFAKRLAPMPEKTHSQKLPAIGKPQHLHYVAFTGGGDLFAEMAKRATAAGSSIDHLPCGHFGIITNASDVGAILIKHSGEHHG